MLIKAKKIKGYKIVARDGEIGKVDQFYFDDKHWTIRYLVADTGNWLGSYHVLLSPYAVQSVNEDKESITVDLTKRQIEDSPSWDADKPVSRQYETSYHEYYGYPIYWAGSMMWGPYPFISRNKNDWNAPSDERSWDPHLCSTKDVTGHFIQALNDEIGHVTDFIIDDDTWAIRYLIVDTGNWWAGKKVLISPQWIEEVNWNDQKVYVNLTKESIRQSPEYTDNLLLDRDYESKLYHYYNREGYWTEEPTERRQSSEMNR